MAVTIALRAGLGSRSFHHHGRGIFPRPASRRVHRVSWSCTEPAFAAGLPDRPSSATQAAKNYLIFALGGTAWCPYLCPPPLGTPVLANPPLLQAVFDVHRGLLDWLRDWEMLLFDDQWNIGTRLVVAPVTEELIYRGPPYLLRKFSRSRLGSSPVSGRSEFVASLSACQSRRFSVSLPHGMIYDDGI